MNLGIKSIIIIPINRFNNDSHRITLTITSNGKLSSVSNLITPRFLK